MKAETILMIGAGILGLQLLTKNKAMAVVGDGIGSAIGGAVGGVGQGIITSVLIEPHEWASNYEGYIPIIDPLAKKFASLKNLGDPNRWFW